MAWTCGLGYQQRTTMALVSSADVEPALVIAVRLRLHARCPWGICRLFRRTGEIAHE
jgi:hypothetical protein